MNPDPELAALLFSALGSNQTDLEPSTDQLSALESALMTCGYSELAENVAHLKTSSKPIVAVLLNEDTPPSSVPQAYLKLHLLSHRLVMPQQTNITGIFGVLKNVAWTNIGAIDINELAARSLESRLAGTSIYVDCVDKFPKMVDYVVPTGVRIADTRRLGLGPTWAKALPSCTRALLILMPGLKVRIW